jgi:hypothetical protein
VIGAKIPQARFFRAEELQRKARGQVHTGLNNQPQKSKLIAYGVEIEFRKPLTNLMVEFCYFSHRNGKNF